MVPMLNFFVVTCPRESSITSVVTFEDVCCVDHPRCIVHDGYKNALLELRQGNGQVLLLISNGAIFCSVCLSSVTMLDCTLHIS